MSEFREQLFPQLPLDRVSYFSCGHVIPTSNPLTLAICKGPKGKELQFRFKNKDDLTMVHSRSVMSFHG